MKNTAGTLATEWEKVKKVLLQKEASTLLLKIRFRLELLCELAANCFECSTGRWENFLYIPRRRGSSARGDREK